MCPPPTATTATPSPSRRSRGRSPPADGWEKGAWGYRFGPSPSLSVCACAANPSPPGSPQERRWGKEEQEAREGAQEKWQGH